MTDEEMAEEQVKKWDSILYPELFPVALVKDFIRKAFIAGLEAGRPKWHDLRKNPLDLPEKNKLVFIHLVGCCVLGWYDGIDFYNDCDSHKIISKEILTAWCEIPKFEGGEA